MKAYFLLLLTVVLSVALFTVVNKKESCLCDEIDPREYIFPKLDGIDKVIWVNYDSFYTLAASSKDNPSIIYRTKKQTTKDCIEQIVEGVEISKYKNIKADSLIKEIMQEYD